MLRLSGTVTDVRTKWIEWTIIDVNGEKSMLYTPAFLQMDAVTHKAGISCTPRV